MKWYWWALIIVGIALLIWWYKTAKSTGKSILSISFRKPGMSPMEAYNVAKQNLINNNK